jgi:hypothetical protein
MSKTFDLRNLLKDTIDALQAKRDAVESTLVTSLHGETKAIACVPLDLQKSAAVTGWQNADKPLAVQIALANEVLAVVDRRIGCFKSEQPGEFQTVLTRQRDELSLKHKVLQEEIDSIDSQLKALKKAS